VATFHGLGLLILREQRKLLGLDDDPKVADEKTRQEILRSLSARERPAALGARIATAKRLAASPGRPAIHQDTAADPAVSETSEGTGTPEDEGTGTPQDTGIPQDTGELADLVARYDAALRERGLVDLDDLVTLPTALLAGDPALAAEYRSRWTDVFVDEYQDVDEQQYLMLRQLAAPGARICGIGDPDQAIYGFRGGDVGYFLRFTEDFGATVDASPAGESDGGQEAPGNRGRAGGAGDRRRPGGPGNRRNAGDRSARRRPGRDRAAVAQLPVRADDRAGRYAADPAGDACARA
jgi:DNA helicase-2/ATP-dependent DNA helicase PcrA